MSYDFFVFPADLAGDLPSATSYYETAAERGVLTPGSPVARFVSSVNALSPAGSKDGFLTEEARGHDGAAYVATTWADPMANLCTVAGLARAHDLAVLDVQLDAFYGPHRALDTALDTEAGPRLPYLTRSVLRDVMSHIGELRYHWVNVSREGAGFAQAYRDDDGSWAVEHREGDRGGHFAARTTDPVLVESLLWSWARGDGRWQAMLAFAPVEV